MDLPRKLNEISQRADHSSPQVSVFWTEDIDIVSEQHGEISYHLTQRAEMYAEWSKIFNINLKLVHNVASQELWPQSYNLSNIPVTNSSSGNQEYDLYDQ